MRPAAGKGSKRGISGEQVQAVLDACEGNTWQGARDAAIVAVLVGTGLRAAELVALDLADVDRTEWTLEVRHGKGDKPRRARLGQAARLAVADFVTLFRGDVAGPLFPSVRGVRLSRDLTSRH